MKKEILHEQLTKKTTLLTPQQRAKVTRDLTLIDFINNSLLPTEGRIVLIGGYGVDAHLGRITRFHNDIDLRVFLPLGTVPQAFIRQLGMINWNENTSAHGWESTLIERSSSDQVELKLYPLSQAPQGDTLSVRERCTNFSYEVSIAKKTLIDEDGKSHEVWVESIDALIANKIASFLSQRTERRSTRASDFDDLRKLLQDPHFDFQKCLKYLTKIIEQILKLPKESAEIIATQELEARSAHID